MITEIDAKLLEKIADLTGQPVGAFNIRKDSGCEARQSTEHIDISPRADGKAGIDIRIKDGTHGEKCHIPVIISKTGLSEMVYNDFYVGDDCDVEIIAGCGIHNSGCDESRHDGVHTFHIGKNSRVRYAEKHYGEDADGETGRNIMNPQTIVYLGENSSMQMETVQIRGIDSTKRYTKFVCEAGAEAVVTERLLTHGDQKATSEMEIELNGKDARGRVISRSVAQDHSEQLFYPRMVGNAECFGHVRLPALFLRGGFAANRAYGNQRLPYAKLVSRPPRHDLRPEHRADGACLLQPQLALQCLHGLARRGAEHTIRRDERDAPARAGDVPQALLHEPHLLAAVALHEKAPWIDLLGEVLIVLRQLRHALRIARLRLVIFIAVEIESAERNLVYSLVDAVARAFLIGKHIVFYGVCRVAARQVEIAYGIVYLVEVFFVAVQPRHALQRPYL